MARGSPQIEDSNGIPNNKRGWNDVSAIGNEEPAYDGIAGRQLVKYQRIIGPEPLRYDPANGENDRVVQGIAQDLRDDGDRNEPVHKATCLLIFEDLCVNAFLPTALVGRGITSKNSLSERIRSFLTGFIAFLVMMYVHNMDYNGTSNNNARLKDLEDADDEQMWEDANDLYKCFIEKHPILGRGTDFEFDLEIQKQYIFEISIKAWVGAIKGKIKDKGIVSLDYLYELHSARQPIQRKYVRAVFHPHAVLVHHCIPYTDRFWRTKKWYLTDVQKAEMKTNPTVFPGGRNTPTNP